MSSAQVNREGLTFEEFYNAAKPADEADHGYIRTRIKLTPQEMSERRMKLGPEASGAPRYIYGSKTRDPIGVLRRAWNKAEDPTEWRAWAERQRRGA